MEDCPTGELSKDHLIEIYTQIFPAGNSEKFCEQVFGTVDTDKNGSIDFRKEKTNNVNSVQCLMFIVCVDSFWTFSKFTKVWQSNADYCHKYSSGNLELENFNRNVFNAKSSHLLIRFYLMVN